MALEMCRLISHHPTVICIMQKRQGGGGTTGDYVLDYDDIGSVSGVNLWLYDGTSNSADEPFQNLEFDEIAYFIDGEEFVFDLGPDIDNWSAFTQDLESAIDYSALYNDELTTISASLDYYRVNDGFVGGDYIIIPAISVWSTSDQLIEFSWISHSGDGYLNWSAETEALQSSPYNMQSDSQDRAIYGDAGEANELQSVDLVGVESHQADYI